MKGIKVYLVDYDCWHSKPVSFEKVEYYRIKKGFLCLKLNDGKSICYNLKYIERFEITEEKEAGYDNRPDA